MSEPTWTPATFEITIQAPWEASPHREAVEGETWGPFGINAEEDDPFPAVWFVTHLPTGHQLVAAVSREAAQEFCDEIAGLTDWESVRPGHCPPAIRDEFLTAWHRARGAMFIDCSDPQAVTGGVS